MTEGSSQKEKCEALKHCCDCHRSVMKENNMVAKARMVNTHRGEESQLVLTLGPFRVLNELKTTIELRVCP